MPASSRKRNKGRDRKAKKAAEEAEAERGLEEARRTRVNNMWQDWARGDIGTLSIKCNHGLDEVVPDESHPVSSFITTFFLADTLKETIPKHKEVLKDEYNRKLAAGILIRIGANMLCSGFLTIEPIELVIRIALSITMLENYDVELDNDSNLIHPILSIKYRDLNCGTSIRRDLLKFFRKRITCSCLKKMHLEVRKSEPKIGLCEHCNDMKERRLLMVCSRCMVSQYCSRECQVAESPEHREMCDKFFDTHKEQQQQAGDTS